MKEYRGIQYFHEKRGVWKIAYMADIAFNCEQDLKNYIDVKVYGEDKIGV